MFRAAMRGLLGATSHNRARSWFLKVVLPRFRIGQRLANGLSGFIEFLGYFTLRKSVE